MKNQKFQSIGVLAAFLFAGTTAFAQQTNDPKTNQVPIEGAVSRISQLEPLSFEYDRQEQKKLKLPSGKQYGFMAEDVGKVIPGIVKNEHKMIPAGKNAFKTTTMQKVEMENLIPFLVASIKEQQAEINKLKEEIRSLKSTASIEK